MTHIRGGIRVEDVSIKNARRQSDILNEIPQENVVSPEPEVPISTTIEQVKEFYLSSFKMTDDSSKKRVYAQTVMWLDELLELRKTVKKYEFKEMVSQIGKQEEEIPDIDIDSMGE